MKSLKIRVLGVSSGIGVSLYPFKQYLQGNIESRSLFHTPKNDIWKANFGEIPLWRDLPEVIPDHDVLISSPDCGAGSILRLSVAKKYGNHQENKSLALFFSVLKQKNPKFFLFENLNGLFKSFPEALFRRKLKNYSLIIHDKPVSHWGNSQLTRKRLVIIGIRIDLGSLYHKFFKLPDYRGQIKTCNELYGDIRDKIGITGHIREDLDEIVTMYGGYKCSLREARRFWLNNPEKSRWTVEGRRFSTAPGVYKNHKHGYPCTARKANRQFDHRGLTLTPRQLARIQGVPDEFIIPIDEANKKYWINKARTALTKSPPYEISFWFLKKLMKLNKRYQEFSGPSHEY